jgi:hypothetical protein
MVINKTTKTKEITMQIGNTVKVTKVTDPKQLMLEGKNAQITAKSGSVFFAVSEDGIAFQFDAEARMGLTVITSYTRKDEAEMLKAELQKKTEDFNKVKANYEKEIDRLENFDSDEACYKAQFKEAVLEAIKD